MACNGRSYEAWDSEITVACVSVGASLVCKVTGYNCGTSGAISAMGQACSVNSAAPIGLVAGFLDGLPEVPPDAGQVLGAVVHGLSPQGDLWTLRYDGHGATPSCTVSLD
jgi:uncharacterized membrane protein